MGNKTDIEAKWLRLVKSGTNAARAKEFAAASAKFREAYELSRKLPDGDRRRGESAYHLAYARFLERDCDTALQLFDEALQHLQNDPQERARCAHVQSILAAIHLGARQLKEAEQHIEQSLELERELAEESMENHQLLASILLAQKRYSDSIKVLEKLLEQQKSVNPDEVPNTLSLLSFARKRVDRLDLPLVLEKEQMALVQESLLRAESEARALAPKYMRLGRTDYAKHFEKQADELHKLYSRVEEGQHLTKRHLPLLIDALWCAEVQAQNSDCLEKAYDISLVKRLLDDQLRQ